MYEIFSTFTSDKYVHNNMYNQYTNLNQVLVSVHTINNKQLQNNITVPRLKQIMLKTNLDPELQNALLMQSGGSHPGKLCSSLQK